MSETQLKQQFQKLKAMIQERERKEFAQNYSEEFVFHDSIEERKEAVLFTDNFHRLMKYLDHVIYSKKKLEREGRRRPDVAKVFLNRIHVDDLDKQQEYVHMKKYKQP